MADTTGKSIKIFIFHLWRIENKIYPDEWAQCIVAAKDERDARTQANEEARSEGYVWADENKVGIQRIAIADDGVSGVILWAPKVDLPQNELMGENESVFLLEKTDAADADQWAKVVVAAKDEKQARTIANNDSQAGSQSKAHIWTDGYLASARKIGAAFAGLHGVVLWAPEVA